MFDAKASLYFDAQPGKILPRLLSIMEQHSMNADSFGTNHILGCIIQEHAAIRP